MVSRLSSNYNYSQTGIKPIRTNTRKHIKRDNNGKIIMGRKEWERKGYGVDGNTIALRASISIELYTHINTLPVGHEHIAKNIKYKC